MFIKFTAWDWKIVVENGEIFALLMDILEKIQQILNWTIFRSAQSNLTAVKIC